MPTCQIRLEANRLAAILEAAFEWEGYPVTREENPPYSGHWPVDTIIFDVEPEDAEGLVRAVGRVFLP
eukprot:gene2745-3736_t